MSDEEFDDMDYEIENENESPQEFQMSFNQQMNTSVLQEQFERNDPRIEMKTYLELLFSDDDDTRFRRIFRKVGELDNFKYLNPKYLSHAFFYLENYGNNLNKENLKQMSNKYDLECPSLIRYIKIIQFK